MFPLWPFLEWLFGFATDVIAGVVAGYVAPFLLSALMSLGLISNAAPVAPGTPAQTSGIPIVSLPASGSGGASVVYHADLGAPDSERNFGLEGWGGTGQVGVEGPEHDHTVRYQQVRGSASLTFGTLAPDTDYALAVAAVRGSCDDSFQVKAGGLVLGQVDARNARPGATVYAVQVPRDAVKDGRLTVVFENVASDNCGLAGIYGVWLVASQP